jgi:hypothetical protein
MSETMVRDEAELPAFWRDHSEREIGLIDPAEKEKYSWPFDMTADFELFSSFKPGTSMVINGRLHVLNHHEENGNQVWSILGTPYRDKMPGLKIAIREVHSFILIPNGQLYGERHICLERYYESSPHIPTQEVHNIKPLDERSLEIFAKAAAYLQELRKTTS